MFGRVSTAEARKRLEPGERHLAFASFDLHVIANRRGEMYVSATLPNGHRTSRYGVNKFMRKIILELTQLIRLYDRRKDIYQAHLQRDREIDSCMEQNPADLPRHSVAMAQDEAVVRGYDQGVLERATETPGHAGAAEEVQSP